MHRLVQLQGASHALYAPLTARWTAVEHLSTSCSALTISLPLAVFSPFLSNLGTSIRPPSNDQASRSATPRPSTPGKPPRVDYGAVRRHLYELWDTEASYFRKIHSLLTVSRCLLVLGVLRALV